MSTKSLNTWLKNIDIEKLMSTHVNFCSKMQKVKVLKAQKTQKIKIMQTQNNESIQNESEII